MHMQERVSNMETEILLSGSVDFGDKTGILHRLVLENRTDMGKQLLEIFPAVDQNLRIPIIYALRFTCAKTDELQLVRLLEEITDEEELWALIEVIGDNAVDPCTISKLLPYLHKGSARNRVEAAVSIDRLVDRIILSSIDILASDLESTGEAEWQREVSDILMKRGW